jgi:hypothetical protein
MAHDAKDRTRFVQENLLYYLGHDDSDPHDYTLNQLYQWVESLVNLVRTARKLANSRGGGFLDYTAGWDPPIRHRVEQERPDDGRSYPNTPAHLENLAECVRLVNLASEDLLLGPGLAECDDMDEILDLYTTPAEPVVVEMLYFSTRAEASDSYQWHGTITPVRDGLAEARRRLDALVPAGEA